MFPNKDSIKSKFSQYLNGLPTMQSFYKKGVSKSSKPGYLLVEIIAALALFAVACLISAQYYWHIIEWQHNASMYAQATTLCQDLLEQKLAMAREDTQALLQLKNNAFSTKCSISSIQSNSYDAPLWMSTHFLHDLKLIKTTVTWKSPIGATKKVIIKTCAQMTSEKIKHEVL
jgi:hypothetical protein